MRIVYVEDNLANVHLVKRVARMGKHEVINYIDGMDALNNFASDEPDLVLMDIQLAGELTGIEVVQKLRDDGHTTPIIAVTAYAMVGDKERCIEAGCTGYMSKPIPVTDLVSLFNKYDQPKEEETAPVEAVKDVPSPTTPVTEKQDTPNAKPTTTSSPDKVNPATADVTESSAETNQQDADKTADPEGKAKTVATKPDNAPHKQPTQPSLSLSKDENYASESEDKVSDTKPNREQVNLNTNTSDTDDDKQNRPEASTDVETSVSAQQHINDKQAKMQ